MKKIIAIISLSFILGGCIWGKTDKKDFEDLIKVQEITDEEKAELIFTSRQWILEEGIRKKRVDNPRRTNNRVTESPDFEMKVHVTGDYISFKIFVDESSTNKSHIGGYTIEGKGGESFAVFGTNRSGFALIERESNEYAYNEFLNFFENEDRSSILVRDGYVTRYRGILDTKYFKRW